MTKKKTQKTQKIQKIPKIGNTVLIAIKPYKGKTAIGIVSKILTKKKFHSRGHKVKLSNGTIGRVIASVE